MTAKFRSIQLLRAVAAVGVVLCHTAGFKLGAAGVDLFFVISGFIIGTVMPGRDALSFLVDRIRRIYPIYFLALLPWAFVGFVFGQVHADRLAASLTLWPLWGGGFVIPFNPPAWTLCFEMLFYCAAAASLALGRKWVPVAVFAGAAALYQLWPGPLLGFIGNPMILEFGAGLLLTRLPRRPAVATAAIPLGLSLFALSPAALLSDGQMAIEASRSIVRVLWWGVPSLALAYAALTYEAAFARREWNGPVLVGDASYSLYLVHVLLALILPFAWPIETVLIVAFGIAFHLAVEKPLLARLRGVRRPAAAGSPANVQAI